MKETLATAVLWIGLAFGGLPTADAQQANPGPLQTPTPQSSTEFFLGPPAQDGPAVVRVEFYLQEVNKIDDEAETVEFTGILKLTWQDDRQIFDPVESGVNEKIYQGEYQFNELAPAWYPQVALVNESGLYEKDATLLRIKPNGFSTLTETVNAVARVNLDLRRCPFDSQRLELHFEILGFGTNEVILEAQTTAVREDFKQVQVPQWTLVDLTYSTDERNARYVGETASASTFVVTMDVKRHSFFLIRLVILPLMLIVMLSWSVFWMDRSLLGDRINVSFIGILTAVAYQMVISDILPRISYITFINAIVNLSFLLMCGTILINLVVDGLDRRGLSKVGDLVDLKCRWIFPLIYCCLISLSAAVIFIWF